MVHELTGLAAGRGKAKAIDHVVKTALDKAQKDLTGVALSAGSLLIIHPELLLQDAINKLDLLLLCELQSIFGLLSSSLTAGILIGSLGITHDGRRNAKRSATLQNGLSIFRHSMISSLTN